MANEFANQYGINLGAIDNAISQKKTAEQNLEINKMRMNALQRQDTKDIASDKAEQDYMKDPTTAVASTIAQKLQWNTLSASERADKTAAMKEHLNQRGIAINSIMNMQDPAQQQQALQQTISKLPPEEQAQVAQKYGATPQEWQQNLPHMMNDLLVADKGVDWLAKQVDTKTQHANKLEEIKIKGESEAGVRANQNAFTSKENALNREATKQNTEAKTKEANAINQQRIDTANERLKLEQESKAERQKNDRLKNVDRITDTIDGFSGLSSDEQKQAKQTYVETGKFPDMEEIGGTWSKVPFTATKKLKSSSSKTTETSTTRKPLSQF